MQGGSVNSEVKRIVEMLQEHQSKAAPDDPPSVLPLPLLTGDSRLRGYTIAKQVFDHPWVASFFDFRCWIDWPPGRDFSEPYDLPAQLVEWLTEEPCVLQDRAMVARAAKDLLSPCRYLVVISTSCSAYWDNLGGGGIGYSYFADEDDDYFLDGSCNNECFAQLMDVLGSGRPGSAIINNGGGWGGSLDPNVLHSWQLFVTETSMPQPQPQQLPIPPVLVDIAHKIIQRCEGLPFLIRHFYKILSTVPPAVQEWRSVLDKFDDHCFLCSQLQIWIENNVRSLSPLFTNCLLYCAPFPRNYIFNIQELIDVWVAQETEPQSICGDLRRRSAAFNEFLDEWFLPHSHRQRQESSYYTIRPERHFILQRINRKWGGRYGAMVTPKACWIAREVRQVCLLVDSMACKFPNPLFKLQNLHKLILVPDEDMLMSVDQRCAIKEVPSELCSCISLLVLDLRATQIKELPREFKNMIRLRYLNLSRTDFDSVPGAIRFLNHLKYLNLSHTNISEAPDFLGSVTSLEVLDMSHCEKLLELCDALRNLVLLERLDLQGCFYLSNLPQGMGCMANLVYLNILECSSLTGMPPRMDQLAKLEELSGYVVGKTHLNAVSDLNPLEKLKVLALDCLENVLHVQQAKDANLSFKYDLVSLSYRWNMDAENAEQVLKSLRPNDGLQNLEIISYPGKKLPQWMICREPYLQSLVHIKLINLTACEILPPLGQLPLLKTAEINRMNAISFIDDSFNGDGGTFPSLEKLVLSHMHNLEIWHQTDQREDMFPRLCELTIIHCPRFAALRVEMKNVRKLSLLMNNQLLYSTIGGTHGVARSVRNVSISLCQELIASDSCKGLLELGHIEELDISACPDLTSLPNGVRYLVSLRSLRVDNCTRLESLPNWLQSFPSLRLLSISDCPALRSIPGSFKRRSGIQVRVEGCPNCSW